MKLKNLKIIFLLTFLVLIKQSFSETIITCRARYFHQVYHPPVAPSYYEGGMIGKVPIAGTGSDGYYEDVWSDTYTLNISFFSGYELNEYFKNNNFNENSIVGLINWSNGGSKWLLIKDWLTNLKYITKEEVMYTSEGNRIYTMKAYDKDKRLWEITM